jgi:hypothetical protein
VDAMFDITRGEENVQDGPRTAEEFIRGQGHSSLAHAGSARGRIDRSEGYLRFPDDAVLLMTGTTRDLLDACEQAIRDGIQMIGTQNDQVLKLLFARVGVSADQTDTLIAIGANQGALRNLPDLAAGGEGWKVATSKLDYTKYVTTLPNTGDDATQPRALPTILQDIKSKFKKAWITPSWR